MYAKSEIIPLRRSPFKLRHMLNYRKAPVEAAAFTAPAFDRTSL